MPPLMGNTIFLAALASLGSMLEGESLSNVFEILSILGHIIRLSSGYVQSMFRVCSEYVQSMFRACPEYVQSMFRVCSEYVQSMFRVYSGSCDNSWCPWILGHE